MVLTHSTEQLMSEKEPFIENSYQNAFEEFLQSTFDDELKLILTEMHFIISHLKSEVKGIKKNVRPLKLYLNSKEVCTMLGISKRSLQTWRDNNKIPFEKLNGKIVYDESVILKWAKQNGKY